MKDSEKVMDLEAIQRGFAGRRFGELVLHHRKRLDLQGTSAAVQGSIQELPEAARPLAETWIDEWVRFGTEQQFWRQDCGDAFADITAAATAKLHSANVQPTANDLFNMFQIIVLNFAYCTHCDPQSEAFIQKAVGRFPVWSGLALALAVFTAVFFCAGWPRYFLPEGEPTPPTTLTFGIGMGIGELGWMLIIAGIVSGKFLVLGLVGRPRVIGLGVVALVVSAFLINMAV